MAFKGTIRTHLNSPRSHVLRKQNLRGNLVKTYNDTSHFNYTFLPLFCCELQPLHLCVPASLYSLKCINTIDSIRQAALCNIYCTVCYKHSWIYMEKHSESEVQTVFVFFLFLYCISISASRKETLLDSIFKYERFNLQNAAAPFSVLTLWGAFLTSTQKNKTFKNKWHCELLTVFFWLSLVFLLHHFFLSGWWMSLQNIILYLK